MSSDSIRNLSTMVKQFIGDGVCLLVEPSGSFSASLQSCLAEVGIPLSQVITSKKFEDALRLIEIRKPKLLVTEYDLAPGLGLALVEKFEANYEESQRIAVIVTKNSSDSAVAEAAEGSVDAFILKPFSTDVFRQKLSEALKKKMFPSVYQQKLQKGRSLLQEKKYDLALAEFIDAQSADARPSLACFGAGQCYERMSKFPEAVEQYRLGQKHTPLHYKCLVGEFELLVKQKNYVDAYKVVPILKSNYPIPPQRLGEIFMAAVFTFNFDDLPKYNETFLNVETRSPWLVNVVSVGFTTAGRFYLQKKDLAKAMIFFEMGWSARGRDLVYLESVFDELIKVEAFQEAEMVLQKVLPADVGSRSYNKMRFLMEQRKLPIAQWTEKGRRMVFEGQGSPEIYRLLVQGFAQMGKPTMAESIIAHAVKEDPAQRTVLYALLEKHTG